MSDFKETMSGVYSTSVCEGTIDESPMAYKSAGEILRLITPTVDVLTIVSPRVNIKNSGE